MDNNTNNNKNNIIIINHNNEHICEIKLIGTAHVSEDSVKKVEQSIIEFEPDIIGIELDKDRFFSLTKNRDKSGEIVDNNNKIDFLKIVKEGNITLFLVQTILSNFQKNIGEKFDIKPGSEMIKAIDLAVEYGKPLALIDRPINITLKRTIDALPFKEKIKLLNSFLFEGEDSELIKVDKKSINEMVNNSEELMKLLNEMSPTVYKVLVNERDKYMAKNIFEQSKNYNKMLVVVGAGHIEGIKKYLKQLENNEINININELLTVKKNKNYFKLFVSILITLIIIYGFWSISSNPEALKKLTLDWILVNGSLSALGTIIARGKIQSVITSFIAAPITSLIPVIGAGYITALVELRYREITSKDIEELIKGDNIIELIKNNNAMRVLLVFILSSLGSVIGTFYFVPGFLSLLF